MSISLNVDPKSFGFTTGTAYEHADIATAKFLTYMRNAHVHNTMTESHITCQNEPAPDNVYTESSPKFIYPVIINVMGVACSGKDTFADKVRAINDTMSDSSLITYRDSIVGIPKRIVENIFTLENVRFFGDAEWRNEKTKAYYEATESAIDKKTDPYRQFLHEIKDSWMKFNGGPVAYTYLTIWNDIDYMRENEQGAGIIFINNRDVDTVTAVKEACLNSGLICFNLMIDGRTEATDWDNACDRNVDVNFADIIIHNDDTIGHMTQIANTFLLLIKEAQHRYGIRES